MAGEDVKIVHVSPTYFAEESILGGAERYAHELARAMSGLDSTTFVSLGTKRKSWNTGLLRVEIFPTRALRWQLGTPVSVDFLRLLGTADVIHCHQLGTRVNVLAMMAARVAGKRCFVTPLGGSPTRGEHRVMRLVGFTGLLCISYFSARVVPYVLPSCVIGGGVDAERFRPVGRKERKIVCVARLMPHKGINYLIEAVEEDLPLEVYGRPYHRQYFDDLMRLAAGKPVRFITDATDEEIAAAYSTALVSVLPSVQRDMYGAWWPEPELLGLTLLEAMACGTAVVGTRVGAIPEHVNEGQTGLLVPPNDPLALRHAVRRLIDDPARAAQFGQNGRELVRAQFTWEAVARRSLSAYAGIPESRRLVVGIKRQRDPQ